MAEKFLTLDKVVVRMGGNLVIDNLDFVIHRGEQWAIVGPSGGGKTVLAHTLLGKHFHQGKIEFHWGVQGKKEDKTWAGEDKAGLDKDMVGSRKDTISAGAEGNAASQEPAHRIAMVEQQHRFRNRPGTTELYYQQRFNASDADQTMTVKEELASYGVVFGEPGLPGDVSGLSGTGNGLVVDGNRLAGWMDLLHIGPLLSKPLIQLSNGENKRVQLAIALSEAPEMLILDNPFLGLDTEGRSILRNIIDELAAKDIQILLITGSQELPEAITHIAQLERGQWTYCGVVSGFSREQAGGQKVELDPDILARLARQEEYEDFRTAVKMVDVTIRYGEATILDRVNWEVRKGEKWNLSGPNGAGKSTILSLITADNPQAYANEIWLFDRRRGTGETIWDIKQKIGFVSPELHLYFEYSASCYEVVASGLFDTIGLFRQLSEEQSERVMLWMKLLSLEGIRSKRLADLSAGQQRMVLLARALIKNPPLLILDEPCQGLDEEHIQYFRQLMDSLCAAFGTTLIYVSHYREELPSCIDRFLVLKKGVVQPE